MSKKLIISILVVAFLISGYFLVRPGNKVGGLESPGLGQVFGQKVTPSPQPSPSPSMIPKTFQFDTSTDLKSELESINPQVLDSDFE